MTSAPKGHASNKLVHTAKQTSLEIVGFLFSLMVLIPFAMIVINSFKTHGEANKLSMNFIGASFAQAMNNYSKVFEEANLVSSLLNSLGITIISTALIVILSAMAAFVVVRRKTKAMHRLNNIIIAGLTLPVAMVPTYYMFTKIGLSNGTGSYVGAILVYTACNFAFAYFLYTGFIKGVSPEIDEAAIIDGVSSLELFFKIVFPLLKPVTVTVIISEAMTVWNDFTVALFLLNSPKHSTAVLTTYLFMGQKSSEWNLLFADVFLVSLPIIILYLLLQKYIVGGLTAGAVKG